MSLISDALRKARREAAARGERGSVPEVVVVRPPTRSITERPTLIVVLAATALAILGVGAGIAWWALGGFSPVSPENPGPATAVATTVTQGSGGPKSTQPQGPIEGASHRTPLGAEPAATGDASKSNPGGAAHEPAHPYTEIEPPRGEETAKTGDTTSAARTADTGMSPPSTAANRHEFVGEATIGETTLRLDYLAYRPNDPFVQINGVELHQGWEIAGYTVERIQTDRVVLVGPEGKIVLRSH